MSGGREATRGRLGVVMWLALLAVACPPVLSSAQNLFALGQDQLGLVGRWALLVPLSVDAAALLCVVLTLRSVYAGQSAGLARLLVAAFAAFSAWLGYQEAVTLGTVAARVFFPAMPIAAALLLDMVLRHRRRDVLAEIGALEPPLPRFRVLRWLIAPAETWRAWSAGVRYGITDPETCIRAVRETDALQGLSEVDAIRYGWHALGSADPYRVRVWLADRGVVVDQRSLDRAASALQKDPSPVLAVTAAPEALAPEVPGPDPVLDGMSKRDAVRHALSVLGSWDSSAARVWLADRGVVVDAREARRVAADAERAALVRPALAAVPIDGR